LKEEMTVGRHGRVRESLPPFHFSPTGTRERGDYSGSYVKKDGNHEIEALSFQRDPDDGKDFGH
jgi:hypothetical protein